MVITLKTIAFDLLNIIRGGKLSDDERISIRQVEYWVANTRATLIRQDLDKGRSVSDNIQQTIDCLEVTQVDLSSCCKVRTGCFGYRTKLRLPAPIELGKRDLLTSVGPTSATAPRFTLIDQSRAPYSIANPKSLSTKVFFSDGYLYFINAPDGLKYVSVSGVFEDPTALAKFRSCNDQECWTDESRYPISIHMIETLKSMILNNNFKLAVAAPSDNTNDGKSDPTK